MISAACLVLVAQVGATFPFPTAISLKAGEVFTAKLERTYTNREEELNYVQTDGVTTKVKSMDAASKRIVLEHAVKPLREQIDGLDRIFDSKTQPQMQTEIRTLSGAQFRFSTIVDEGDTLMLLSRFLSLPLPDKAPAVDDAWEFNDRRFLPYTFRGRYLGFEDGAHKVRVFFKALEAPNYTANGTVWLGAKGVPVRVDITATPVPIPGGELGPTDCRIVYRLGSPTL